MPPLSVSFFPSERVVVDLELSVLVHLQPVSKVGLTTNGFDYKLLFLPRKGR